MLLELVGFFGAFIVLLIFFAEFGKNYAGGIIAGVLLIILGSYVFLDGIQIKMGEMTTISGDIAGTSTTDGESETKILVNASTTAYNESTVMSYYPDTTEITTDMYADLPPMPFISFEELFGLILVLTGLYTIFVYTYK